MFSKIKIDYLVLPYWYNKCAVLAQKLETGSQFSCTKVRNREEKIKDRANLNYNQFK